MGVVVLSEIAQAFVRIRPDTRGFQAEAEGGVRSAFGRLARVAAAAFAVKEVFHFGKEIIDHAADVQKQIEVVKSEFGGASEAILQFSENGAKGLGISAHLAESTAARFGILFRNIGVGPAKAAEMTIGLEKLAGSLSAIRGVDPSIALKNIPLAIAGNLRSLKQLGISTDQTQLKIAAFKLGLTGSVTEALTPATRAQAIYAVATAHLAEFQAQAAAHGGDLANVQRRLAAAFDNAKDTLGRGLLPAMTRLVTFIANVLPGALSVARRVFRDIGAEIGGLARFIAPAIRPIFEAIHGITDALSQNGIGGAIAKIRADFATLTPAGKGVIVILGLVGAAFVTLFAEAAPITAAVIGVVALGVAFRAAYNHSQRFRDVVATVSGFVTGKLVPAFHNFEAIIAPIFATAGRVLLAWYGIVVRVVEGAIPAFERLIGKLQHLSPAAKEIGLAIGGIALALAGVALGPIAGVAVAIGGIAVALHAVNRSGALAGIIATLEGLRAPARRAATAIREGIGKALEFVGSHRRVFEVIAGAVAGAAAGFVVLRTATAAYGAVAVAVTAIQLALDGALAINPVVLIALAIGALVGALVVLYNRSATVRRVLNGLFDGLKRAGEAALPVLRAVLGGIERFGRAAADFITGSLIPAVRSIARIVAPVFGDVVSTIREGLGAAAAVIHRFVAIAIPIAEAFAAVFVGIFRVAVKVVHVVWANFGGAILRVIRVALNTAVGIVRGALRVIRGIFEVISGLVTGDWRKLWKGVRDILGGAFDAIKAQVAGEKDVIVAIFDALWKAVERVTLIGIEKVIHQLARVKTSFKIGGQQVGFENPFKGLDAKLKDSIDGLRRHAKDAAEKIPKAVSNATADANAKASRSVSDAAKKTADVIGRGADSAQAGAISGQAAAASAAAAKSAADSVTALTTQLNRTATVQDAAIAKTRAKLRGIGTQIADAITQQAQDVKDAVTQAEGNLNSIGQTLSSSIGALLDKPFQDAADRAGRQGNKATLESLRRSVLLPGGKTLSTDPTKALAQLNRLAKSSGSVNKGAIDAFISQYRAAVLSVQQDNVGLIKARAQRSITDLTDAFNRGDIDLKTFKRRIIAELTRDRIPFRRAGALMGSAFAHGLRDQLHGLFAQATAIAATPASSRAGVSGSDIAIIKPLETLRKDQRGIATLTHQKQDTQIALQRRIAKAAEATVKLQEKIKAVQVNPISVPRTGGKGTKTSNALAGTSG